MNEFLQAAFTFPTAIFSVLLIPVLLYWLAVILGAVDLEILDGAFDGLDGGADGLGAEALDAGEAASAVDGAEGGSGLLAALGLSGVPVTIAISVLVVLGWFLSFIGMELFGSLAAGFVRGVWLAIAILLLATAVAIGLTALAIRPLRPIFATQHGPQHRELVGRPCKVTTLRVDTRFGQAEAIASDGGALLLQIRCSRDNQLTRGSQALIFDYNPKDGSFLVIPLDASDLEKKTPGA